MESLILRFMPILDNYPVFLIFVEIVCFCFFGGFIFSAFWNLIMKVFGN